MLYPHEQVKQRKARQQHNIERQDIEVTGQGVKTHDPPHPAHAMRQFGLQIVNRNRRKMPPQADNEHIGHNHDCLAYVKLHTAPQQAAQCYAHAVFAKGPPVSQPGRISRQQHEHLGRIGKADIAHGKAVEQVLGNMIDKHHQQSSTPQRVHPMVTPPEGQRMRRCGQPVAQACCQTPPGTILHSILRYRCILRVFHLLHTRSASLSHARHRMLVTHASSCSL